MAVWMYKDLEVYFYLVLEMKFQDWGRDDFPPITFP